MNKKYQIFLNNWVLVKIIQVYFNLPTITISINNTNIPAVDPVFYLTHIYHQLYSPDMNKQWPDLFALEQQLIKKLPTSNKPAVKQTNKLAAQIIKQLLFNNKNFILLGEHALVLLSGQPSSQTILTTVSNLNVNQIKQLLQQIFNSSVDYKQSHVHALQDFRLERWSFTVNNQEIMYVFNSCHYELVPYNTVSSNKHWIQIGNPFVIYRFLLIDYWILQIVGQTGKLDAEFVKQKQNLLMFLLQQVRKKHQQIIEKNQPNTSFTVFNYSELDYMGVYVPESIAEKQKQISKSQPPAYLPRQYLQKNGQYRIIN